MAFSNPILIAVKGPLGAGKTTGAQYLVDKHGFVRVSFADALKCEVFDSLLSGQFPYEIVAHFGVSELAAYPHPERPVGIVGLNPVYTDSTKIAWVNKNKTALRSLLQYWGTEFRRSQDEDYWVKKFVERTRDYMNEGISVVTDDCRFPNEKAAVKSLGGKIVFIHTSPQKIESNLLGRDGVVNKGIAGHASEADNDPTDPSIDMTVYNLADEAHFKLELDLALECLSRTKSTASHESQ